MSKVNVDRIWADTKKQEVLCRLGWDELEYNSFQFESVMQELDRLCDMGPEDTALTRACVLEVASNPFFWAWYRNKWQELDYTFLQACKCQQVAERRACYEAISRKVFEFSPHRAVMEPKRVLFEGKTKKRI